MVAKGCQGCCQGHRQGQSNTSSKGRPSQSLLVDLITPRPAHSKQLTASLYLSVSSIGPSSPYAPPSLGAWPVYPQCPSVACSPAPLTPSAPGGKCSDLALPEPKCSSRSLAHSKDENLWGTYQGEDEQTRTPSPRCYRDPIMVSECL